MYRQYGRKALYFITFLLLLGLVGSLFAGCAGPQEEAYRTIVITEVEGTVTVSSEKQQNTAAYAGMALFDGDTVSVAADGRLTLELDGDKYMMAQPGTVFRLEASGTAGSDKTVIHLESGAALTRVTTVLNEEQSYVVKTPTATISVRGTVYYVEVTTREDGRLLTTCDTLEGNVAVQPIDEFGKPAEPLKEIPAGYRAGVIEITEAENEGVQSATFVIGKSGEAEEPVDYNELPAEVIEELIHCLEEGEELPVSKEQLEEYIQHQHTYSQKWSHDAYEHWHTALCSHSADLPSEIRADVAEHSFDEGRVARASTETEAGVMVYTCTVCGYEKEEPLPLAEHTHTWTEDWNRDDTHHWHSSTCSHEQPLRNEEAAHSWSAPVTVQPTHAAAGYSTVTCTVCGCEKTETLAMLPHEWTWDSNEDGHTRSCDCGLTEQGDHSFGEAVETQKATHTVAGQLEYTCTACAYAVTEELPKLEAHVWGPWTTDETNHSRTCPCGETESTSHTYSGAVVTKQPTHTQPGEREFTCAVCRFVLTEEVAKTSEHNWGAWTLDTKDDTYHTRSCPCGEIESSTHTYSGAVVTKQPTHTQPGEREFTCAVCSFVLKEEVAKTSAHNWGSWTPDTENNTHHTRTCECGETESVEHTMDSGVAGTHPDGVPATVYSCSQCSYQRYKKLPQPPASGTTGVFAVDGVGEADWQAALSDLAKPDSSETVYLLSDIMGDGFGAAYGGLNLPCFVETQTGTAQITSLTMDLYGRGVQMSMLPQIAAGSTLTIQATGGGMICTGGIGIGNASGGTIVINGGMYDFDPTAYVTGGYGVTLLTEPKFVASDGTSVTYSAVLAACGSYHAALASGNYVLQEVGLWIVAPTDQAFCPDTAFRYRVYAENSYYDFCSACGEVPSYHFHTGGEAGDCQSRSVCTECGMTYGSYGPHITGDGYLTDSTSHWLVCGVCGVEQERAAHSGGTATYVSCAVCTTCNEAYGDYLPIEPAAMLSDRLLTVGINPFSTPADTTATTIGFQITGASGSALSADVYLDGVSGSTKTGLSYSAPSAVTARAHGYLFIRSKLYGAEDTLSASFIAPNGYSIVLVDAAGTLTRLTSGSSSTLSGNTAYILTLRDAVADALISLGRFEPVEFMSKYAAADPYGCLVLVPVLDETDVVLTLGGAETRLVWDNDAIYRAVFNASSGSFTWTDLDQATDATSGAGMHTVPVYSLGSISYIDTITSSCVEEHTGHTAVTGDVVTNLHLQSDGSSILTFRSSALPLPDGTDGSGYYTHFAEAWCSNADTPRIFFYFTMNDTVFCYYADLATAEDDLSGQTQSCYDKTSSADFGWSDTASAIYNEYFGSGAHTGLTELTPAG